VECIGRSGKTGSTVAKTFSERNALLRSRHSRRSAADSANAANLQKVCCARIHFDRAVPPVRLGLGRPECDVQNVFAVPAATALVRKQAAFAPDASAPRRHFRRHFPVPENSTPRPVLHVTAQQYIYRSLTYQKSTRQFLISDDIWSVTKRSRDAAVRPTLEARACGHNFVPCHIGRETRSAVANCA
jgi:hypothetical protein